MQTHLQMMVQGVQQLSLHFVLVVFSASCDCSEDFVGTISQETRIPKLTILSFLH